MQIIYKNILAKLVYSVSLCYRLCKKLRINGILIIIELKIGSKQRFSSLLEKVVIQAVYLKTQAVSVKALFYT